MMKRIPFGVWEPDSNAVGGMGRLTEAVNVIPIKGGYKPIDGWAEAWQASGGGSQFATQPIMPTGVINAYSIAPDNAVTYADIISTTTALYYMAYGGATATVVTGDAATANIVASGISTVSNLYYRDMTQYGSVVIAASGTNASGTAPLVSYVVGATAFVDIGAGFQADFITTLRDFVVAGSTRDAVDGTRRNRVRWSAFGDYTQWTPSAATQADIQDLVPEYGSIRRLLGGNDAFIICEHGVVMMEYVGGATIMRFTYTHKNVGTAHPLSCVRVGEYVYMYSQSGFVRVGKAPGDVTPIGEGRVDKYFYTSLMTGLGPGDDTPAVRGYHDESNGCVCWQYGNDGRAFAYSYRYDQWTHHGTSTDRANAYFIYMSAIAAGAGINLPDYYQRRRVPTAIGGSGIVYCQLDEAKKAKVVLSTGFEELSPGKKSIVDKVWPITEIRGGTVTNPELVITSIPKISGVNLYAEPTSTYSSTAALQSDGFFTVTGAGSREGRYHRFQFENSDTASERAGEQAILGIDVEFFERGNY